MHKSSFARLEKLLDILRNKVIDAADGEQSKDPGNPSSVKVRPARSVSGLEAEQDAEKREEDEDGDEEASFREKVAALVENGIKVSGPVTDL